MKGRPAEGIILIGGILVLTQYSASIRQFMSWWLRRPTTPKTSSQVEMAQTGATYLPVRIFTWLLYLRRLNLLPTAGLIPHRSHVGSWKLEKLVQAGVDESAPVVAA